jgi:hypothetical protein
MRKRGILGVIINHGLVLGSGDVFTLVFRMGDGGYGLLGGWFFGHD